MEIPPKPVYNKGKHRPAPGAYKIHNDRERVKLNQELHRTKLGDGVYFSSIQDRKFKHNCISVNLITPLEETTVTTNAILPYLLRRGSKKCPDFTKLEQTLCELYGASLSADTGKSGERQILTCTIVGIDDRFALEGESVSAGCARLLGEILLSPNITDGAFPEEDFRLERQNLIDTIQADINDKRAYTLSQCKALMCEGHRLAIPRYGWVEKAEQITPQMAAEQYQNLIDTAQVEIIFVGCGSPDGAREEFSRLFGALARHPAPFTPEPIVETAAAVKEKTVEMEIAQSKMAMGFRTGKIADKAQLDAVKLMAFLYGGTPFSRLFVHVREEKSLCYYCAARFDQVTGIMMVDIGVERDNQPAARAAILEQLQAVANGDFTDEELESARLSYVNSLRSVPDTLTGMESWYLAQILRGTQFAPEEEVTAIARVGREEVIAAAKKVTLDTVYFLASQAGETGEKEESQDE